MFGNTFEEEEQYPQDIKALFIGDEEEYWLVDEELIAEFI